MVAKAPLPPLPPNIQQQAEAGHAFAHRSAQVRSASVGAQPRSISLGPRGRGQAPPSNQELIEQGGVVVIEGTHLDPATFVGKARGPSGEPIGMRSLGLDEDVGVFVPKNKLLALEPERRNRNKMPPSGPFSVWGGRPGGSASGSTSSRADPSSGAGATGAEARTGGGYYAHMSRVAA